VDFEGYLFNEFTKIADRIVLDSRTWPNPLPALTTLATLVRANGALPNFSDLQWVTLTQWRRLIAHAFDLPAARKALLGVSEIVIDYGGDAPVSTAALLLAGWLMSRLGWKINGAATRDETGCVLPLRRGSGAAQTEIMLAFRRRDAEEGIGGVQIYLAGEHEGRITFDITPDDAHIRTSIELTDVHPLVQTTHLRRREPAELLGEELAFNTGDPVYQATLVAGAGLAESLAPVIAYNGR
jgi:hypothetical protein